MPVYFDKQEHVFIHLQSDDDWLAFYNNHGKFVLFFCLYVDLPIGKKRTQSASDLFWPMVRGPFGQPVSKNNWQFELFLLTGLRVSNRNQVTWQKERLPLRGKRLQGLPKCYG